MPQSGAKPVVKEWLYRKIFTEEFNLDPRGDRCEVCDLLRISIQAAKSEPETVQSQEEFATHQELASQGYHALHSDTEASKLSDDFLVITFDLMQNLPVSTLPIIGL